MAIVDSSGGSAMAMEIIRPHYEIRRVE